MPASHRQKLRSSESVRGTRICGVGCGVVRREKKKQPLRACPQVAVFSFEAGMECGLHAYPVEMRFSGEADGIL